MAAQQKRFDGFVEEFNWQRSHEALGRLTPGSVHEASQRPYPARLQAIDYYAGVTVRRVGHNSEFQWRGRSIYISQVLAKEPIALVACDNDCFEIRYSFHLLGHLCDCTLTIHRANKFVRQIHSKLDLTRLAQLVRAALLAVCGRGWASEADGQTPVQAACQSEGYDPHAARGDSAVIG